MTPHRLPRCGFAQRGLRRFIHCSASILLLLIALCGGGLSALAKIKADPKTSFIPVMMLTGERNAETVLQAMDGGADDYMVKPFLPDTLLERVSRLVNKASRPAATATWEI